MSDLMSRLYRIVTLHPRAWVAMRFLYGTTAHPLAITSFASTPWKAARRCHGWAYVWVAEGVPSGPTKLWSPHADFVGPFNANHLPLDQYSYASYTP